MTISQDTALPSGILEASSARLLDSLPDAAILVDPRGAIRFVNESASQLFGYAPAELAGLSVDMLVPRAFRRTHARRRKGFGKSPRRRQMAAAVDFECVRKDGSTFAASILLDPVVLDDETWAWAVIRDVTAASGDLDRDRRTNEAFEAIGQILATSPSLDIDFETVAALINDIVPWDRISVLVRDEASDFLTVLFFAGEAIESVGAGAALATNTSLAGLTIERKEVQVFTAAEAGTAPEGLSLAFAVGYEAVMAAPLMSLGETVGALVAHTRGAAGYSPADRHDFKRIADRLAGAVESARLKDRLRREAEAKESLAAIGRSASAALVFGGEATEFSDLVHRLVPNESIIMSTVAPDGENMTIAYIDYRGMDSIPGWERGTVRPLKGTTAGLIMKTHLPFVQNFGSAAEFHAQFPGSQPDGQGNKLRSVINLPLIFDDQVYGFLTLRSSTRDFTETDLEAAQNIAVQIAGPVALGELRRREEKLSAERAILARIGRTMSSTFDIGSVWDDFCAQLQNLFSFNSVHLVSIDEEAGLLTVQYARFFGVEPVRGREQGDSYPLSRTIAEKLTRTLKGELFNPESAADWKRAFPGGPHGDGEDSLMSTLAVPLIRNDRAFAELLIQSAEPHAYDEDALHIAERVATEISGPVAGAELYNREQELAQEIVRRSEVEADRQRLAAVNDAKTEFVGILSHELKTPLTSIRAFADILAHNRGGALTDREMKQVGIIQRNSSRLESLIDDLLDLSRIETGRLDLVYGEFNGAEMLQEAVESLAHEIAVKNQGVELDLAGADAPIDADRHRMLQVVTNLLSNASKYSPPATTITLSGTVEDGMFKMSITDEGFGLPGGDPEDLFQLFHRGKNTATRRASGTGIGLYVARRIVERHSGSIVMERNRGDGATARLTIPVAPPA